MIRSSSTAPARKRALIVAYFFPPLGGGGVQRTMGFVRHLPRYGWDPVVIAPRNPGYEIRDASLEDRVPSDLIVHRSPSPEPWWPIFRRLQRIRARFTRPARVPGSEAPAPSNNRRSVRIAAHIFFPDDHITWIPFAVWSAARAARRYHAAAIVSSSPPISGHLIAGITARLAKIPWIADFRDPWVDNPFAPALTGPHRLIQRRIERWIVSHAHRVIAATPTLRTDLQARYPEAAARIATVTNGYDSEEIRAIPRGPRSDRTFRLVYSGAVYGGVLEVFLRGLERFRAEHPALAATLRVEFIGWLDSASANLAAQFQATSPAGTLVTFSGHRPRSEAIAAAAVADGALYLLGDDPAKRHVVGGKLYEYIGLDLPILAVVPPGDCRWVLESLDWGVVVDPVPEAVSAGLAQLLTAAPRHGRADPDGRFNRKELTGGLAQLLDQLTDRRVDDDREPTKDPDQARS